jgi:hypothetical protein
MRMRTGFVRGPFSYVMEIGTAGFAGASEKSLC